MNSSSLYRGARNGDSSNSEAQFQGRVVENAWVFQQELENRKRLPLTEETQKHHAFPYSFSRQGPEICTLKTNEICVKAKKGSSESSQKDEYANLYETSRTDIVSYSEDNGYPYVISAFNGCSIGGISHADFIELPYEVKRAMIRNKWQLAGIVGTNNDSLGFHGEIGRPDLPIQLGGVYTISNFGEKTIHQGDLVVWNAPVLKADGHEPVHVDETPDEKCVIATEPYDPKEVFGWNVLSAYIRKWQTMAAADQDEFLNELVRYIEQTTKPSTLVLGTAAQCLYALGLLTGANPANVGGKQAVIRAVLNFADIEKILEPMFIAMAEQRADYNSRIVGRALTDGLPGNNFNIYMGNYCV